MLSASPVSFQGRTSNPRGQTLKLSPCLSGHKSQPGCGILGLDLGWAVWCDGPSFGFPSSFSTPQSQKAFLSHLLTVGQGPLALSIGGLTLQ